MGYGETTVALFGRKIRWVLSGLTSLVWSAPIDTAKIVDSVATIAVAVGEAVGFLEDIATALVAVASSLLYSRNS